MNVEVLRSAQRDLIAGYRFYERQSRGAGAYFIESLYADIGRLARNAGVHPVGVGGFHRLLSRRFPYAIYYRIEGEAARVFAVLDCRRDPNRMRRRLEK